MRPILDIQKVHPDLFTYALAAAAAPGLPCGDFFVTVVSVLQDAGRLLSRYFDCVEIRLAGFPLGNFPVTHLVEDPVGVFEALTERMRPFVAMPNHAQSHAAPAGDAGRRAYDQRALRGPPSSA